MTMQRISSAILDKVKAEAREIVKDAEEKAYERLEQATKQQEARFEAEKAHLIEAAEGEAARILAQASIEARLELSAAKARIVDDIVGKLKSALGGASAGRGTSLNLVKEAIEALGSRQAVVLVAPKDVDAVRKLVKEDKALAGKVKEVREYKCLGGVIVEDTAGRTRIDNSYEARIEKLLPQILPEISKELFGTK